ncbi:5-formyltetrahydrofolate cyclo-ligase [Streptococcus ruminantium]|uniref:5-formyltetrahydrofolate cyclo-ligase n=2 Tax=Streptococcus ruminantium TaxID=1917441 RepID=A0ABU1B5J6_9STRE|nr:5-formyltetrahydrofolate cyclo-ligase [Streptococcus ruminantium]MDQ8759728.1 5-formyltetrahydrofolate cyclo-ligase [Streptococcus ruminantium]MDQ8764098.1 5-formyltetrahydrofolate cyclo-ligase [Streptococcus ruminantium]MDQ8767870.1 5-formyltetrahydrofolate cyclo-ligase [Streptococcus ruminantium]MDQ8769827.1 5-formyltetrahydrofolate cyclo-ligase [Streptococcus ruminantium]MDQ8774602.1 5-formyltetrahydrofolate cyclo-ligase [Streptococcus ruminantium]
MDKKEIRNLMLTRMKELSNSQRARWSRRLTENLLQTQAYKASKSLGTYISMPHEFDTAYLLEQAQKDGKRLFIPKTYSQGRMDFVEYNPDDLVKSSFGIWEPATYSQPVDKSVINLIHVPGLAWNQAGFRIGYGGGFYDRYLMDFQGKTFSTLLDFQLYDFVQESFDIPVKEMLIFEGCI